MNIGAVQLGFGIEVPGKISLNIYVSGCRPNKKCDRDKCHNPKLKDFDVGEPYERVLPDINNVLNRKDLVECVAILGGEPLDQFESELVDLITHIQNKSLLPVYIYSGYSYTNKKTLMDKLLKEHNVKGICTGEYRQGKGKIWITINEE